MTIRIDEAHIVDFLAALDAMQEAQQAVRTSVSWTKHSAYHERAGAYREARAALELALKQAYSVRDIGQYLYRMPKRRCYWCARCSKWHPYVQPALDPEARTLRIPKERGCYFENIWFGVEYRETLLNGPAGAACFLTGEFRIHFDEVNK